MVHPCGCTIILPARSTLGNRGLPENTPEPALNESESRDGGGPCILLPESGFPLAPAGPLTATMPTPPAPSRILIADDNQQNRELLEAYLADEGHEILMSVDGQQTLEVAQMQIPDLILLDIMMPKLSGYEVCQRLRQSPATRDIPVLMVTALKDSGDIERAVAAGADDFLTKPVHRLELITRVRSLLRVRQLQHERDRLLAYLQEVEPSFSREHLRTN